MAEAEAEKKACGLCGKTKKLTKTSCCKNWICDDEHKYVMFSYARNSCHRNHRRFTLCGFHHSEQHGGKWQDCEKCKDMPTIDYVDNGTNEYNFEKLQNTPKITIKCHGCGFTSDAKKDFPTRLGFGPDGFFCAKEQCRLKAYQPIFDEIYKRDKK